MLLNPYRFAAGGGGGEALLTGLVSYWKMDEASGNALDAHGTNHLTPVGGTIGTAAGRVGTARDFESSSSQNFGIPRNASLLIGALPFTIAAWVKFESLTASMSIVSMDQRSPSDYSLYYDTGTGRFRGEVWNTSQVMTRVIADAFGAASIGPWHFVVFWRSTADSKIYIQINNAGINETAFTGTMRTAAPNFIIGMIDWSPNYPFDGLIDEVGFWTRALTADERTHLYNAGNGRAYPFT